MELTPEELENVDAAIDLWNRDLREDLRIDKSKVLGLIAKHLEGRVMSDAEIEQMARHEFRINQDRADDPMEMTLESLNTMRWEAYAQALRYARDHGLSSPQRTVDVEQIMEAVHEWEANEKLRAGWSRQSIDTALRLRIAAVLNPK